MRCYIILPLLAVSLSLVPQSANGAAWQELLDQADSLVAAGNLDFVEATIDKALALALDRYGRSDTTVAVDIYGKGTHAIRYFRSYAEAESIYGRVISIRERMPGDDNADLAWFLCYLAQVYWQQDKHKAARDFYTRALSVLEKDWDIDAAIIQRHLGLAMAVTGDYDSADSLLDGSLQVLEQALGPKDPEVATCVLVQATLHRQRRDCAGAEPLYERALSIYEGHSGQNHPNVATAMLGLAICYSEDARYSEAESLYTCALGIRERLYGSDDKSVTPYLYYLARCYTDQGRYTEAESRIKRCLAINERAWGPEHLRTATSLQQLAVNLSYQGRTAEVEPLYLRALEIYRQSLDPVDPYIGVTLLTLGVHYSNQLDCARALSYSKQALEIFEQSLDPEDPLIASALNNIAETYRQTGLYAEAEPLYRQALAIKEKNYGPDHPEVASTLSNLGLLCLATGRDTEAQLFFERSLAIQNKVYGDGTRPPNESLWGLAQVCTKRGEYDQAYTYLNRALTHLETMTELSTGWYAWIQEAMSAVHRLRNENAEAVRMAGRALTRWRAKFRENTAVLSERDALTFSQGVRWLMSNYLSCCSDCGFSDPSLVENAATMVLSCKGTVSEGIFERQSIVATRSDSTMTSMRTQLGLVKSKLSDLVVEGPGEWSEGYWDKVDSLGRLADRLESEVSRYLADSTTESEDRDVTVSMISSQLPPNSALVEYVKYDYLQPLPGPEIPRYMVVAIAADAEPLILELGEASTIEASIDRYREHIQAVSSAGRMPTVVDQEHYKEVSDNLCRSIWQSIESYLAGRNLLFIAPDGALNSVSFAGLMDGEGRYLVEATSIQYLSSGRDLMRFESEVGGAEGLFTLGAPDYDASALARRADQPAPGEPVMELAGVVTRNVRSGCGEIKGLKAAPLPATRREVEMVARAWKQITDEPLTVCVGAEASEERFKIWAPGNRVLHLATHGYYLEGACRGEPPERMFGSYGDFVGENPLLQSGLLLAGANLRGAGADSLGLEDGILTAYEVSAMDLSGTQLVVLSACETGLGKVEQGEGVYGLRRAFQMAGARTVVSALWPVSDEATADMMSQLYKRKGQSIPETLRLMQLTKINQLRRNGHADHPFTWAAFIAVGDWK